MANKVTNKPRKLLISISLLLSVLSAGTSYAVEYNASSNASTQSVISQEENHIQWVYRDGKWYGYDANGMLCHGWVEDKGNFFYLNEEGICLLNQMTPDGYYVDANGAWYQRVSNILDDIVLAPKSFPATTESWSADEDFKTLQENIDKVFEERRIRITDDSVEYLAGGSEETILMAIHKDKEKGTFRLDLRQHLDKESKKPDQAATYDYQVFRAFLYKVTSTPELLEDAIYSSWEEENSWKITRTSYTQVGDAKLKYIAGNGSGHYQIQSILK